MITNVNAFDRIVGGTAVTVDKYPFIVSISGRCGGSILRKSYPAIIITAAHCKSTFDSESNYVRLYSNDLSGSNADSIDSAIDHYVIHPNYDDDSNSNDIALLWLKEDISSNNKLKTIEIDPVSIGSECCTSGDNLQVIGYGTDCSGCGATPTLEFVDVDYVNRASCTASYGSTNIDDTMNCAAMTDSDSCQGDSGGPLIVTGTNKQVGIVSWGYGCAVPNYPGVYADLGIYYDWIIQQIDGIDGMDDIVTIHGTQFKNVGPSLIADSVLNKGEGLVSENKRFTAVMQPDGNFVIYDLNDDQALWATHTHENEPIDRFMKYQTDGNFVLYELNYQPLWASHTHGQTTGYVIMQDDGNLVIYDGSSTAQWASSTNIATIIVHSTVYNNVGSKLFGDGRINTNEALVSLNRRYVAVMQTDGNFVIYDLQNWLGTFPLWATNTWQHTPINRFMRYQPDGNFVLYDASNWSPKWASNTHGKSVGFVIMQDDGNLVVYDESSVPVWASNTWQAAAIFYGGYLIGFLVIINIIFLMIHYYRKWKASTKNIAYKVVSLDSSDCDEDGIDVENKILINNK